MNTRLRMTVLGTMLCGMIFSTTTVWGLMGDQLPGLRLVSYCLKPTINNGHLTSKQPEQNGRYLVAELSFAGAVGTTHVFPTDFHLIALTNQGSKQLIQCLAVGRWEEDRFLPGDQASFMPQGAPCMTFESHRGYFCLVFCIPKEVKSVSLEHIRAGFTSVAQIQLDGCD